MNRRAAIGLAVGAALVGAWWLGRAMADSGSEDVARLEPEAIACQIDEVTEAGSAVAVPLVVVRGNEIVDDAPVEYRGVSATARLNIGDDVEPQGFLQLVMVDRDGLRTDSTLYDYEVEDQVGPINILNVDTGSASLRFQCWIDR